MYVDISFIVAFIFFLLVLISEYRRGRKEAEKKAEHWEKSWRFCKKLLDNTRAVLTKSQREEVEAKNMNVEP